jgi:hypothetical protein
MRLRRLTTVLALMPFLLASDWLEITPAPPEPEEATSARLKWGIGEIESRIESLLAELDALEPPLPLDSRWTAYSQWKSDRDIQCLRQGQETSDSLTELRCLVSESGRYLVNVSKKLSKSQAKSSAEEAP